MLLLLRAVYSATGAGIPCPVLALSGLFCPGCGMFRAIDALLRLDVWQAVRFNALAVFLLPLLLLFLLRSTARYILKMPKMPTSRPELIFSISVAAVSIMYAVARNLPFLEMLRPTGV